MHSAHLFWVSISGKPIALRNPSDITHFRQLQPQASLQCNPTSASNKPLASNVAILLQL